MDQFEDLSRRNKKITKIVLGFPLLICVLVVAAIMLCLPFFINVGKVRDLEKEILSDQDITDEELSYYIDGMEKDKRVNDFLADDFGYNNILLNLYLQKEDYDQVIKRASAAIKKDDMPLYHYYLGAAYDKTGMKDLSIEEMKTFLQGNIDTASDDNWARKVELARISVANDYYAKGDYAKSKELAEKVLRERIAMATGPKAETLSEFKSMILDRKDYAVKSADSDRDGLSDNLEDLIGTDKNNKDGDGDGYEDKKELLFGYNPSKKSPGDKVTDYELCNTYSKVFTYYPSVYNH